MSLHRYTIKALKIIFHFTIHNVEHEVVYIYCRRRCRHSYSEVTQLQYESI